MTIKRALVDLPDSRFLCLTPNDDASHWYVRVRQERKDDGRWQEARVDVSGLTHSRFSEYSVVAVRELIDMFRLAADTAEQWTRERCSKPKREESSG